MDIQRILVVDDDQAIAFGIANALECPGREIVICRDAESAELVIDRLAVDVVISDVRLSGPFRFEGLDLLDYIRMRAPRALIISMSGSGAVGLAGEATNRGATFLEKPFSIKRLEAIIPAPARPSGESSMAVVPTLAELLASNAIVPYFQPVMRLAEASVFAFEALARVPGEPLFDNPTALFRYADRKQRTVEVGLLCVRRAIELAPRLDSSHLTLINVDSRLFNEAGLHESVVEAAEKSGRRLDRLVLELTEQHPFVESAEAFKVVEKLRAEGVRFAFDDVGVAYSHLPLIAQIRPEFLKISQQFGTGFEADPVRTKLVRNIVALADDFDCDVILEGIESSDTAQAARDFGIALGQGFFFGRPAPVANLTGAQTARV